ncbi:MAG TPA: hypothetical protein VGE38_03460 [Nocardioides sp.]|uniref:hypothetical protein n=1 Tax=Nocardioides sp. TaxID=35761 RepID=UPI002EDA0C84
MFILLAVPVVVAIAATHRYLQVYAPSNVLARWARARPASWRTVTGLVAVAGVLVLAMHAAAAGATRGAPGWLNLVVLILAWDAIKVSCLAVGVVMRGIGHYAQRIFAP